MHAIAIYPPGSKVRVIRNREGEIMLLQAFCSPAELADLIELVRKKITAAKGLEAEEKAWIQLLEQLENLPGNIDQHTGMVILEVPSDANMRIKNAY
jgi:hypothetical protein